MVTGDGPASATPAKVLEAVRSRGLTLATAESLTGGLVGAVLTAVPGSSDAYRGGIVCYATDLKASLAGVPEAVLAAYGPVAPQTATALADGIVLRCGADLGVAVTGVAGPTPQDGHPVGEVYVAVAGPPGRSTRVRRLRLDGDRDQIRSATVEAALSLVLEVLADG